VSTIGPTINVMVDQLHYPPEAMELGLKFGIVALIALVLTVAPGGGPTLNVFLTLLTIAFFVVIGLFGFRLFREHRFTLDALTDRQRLVLYGSVGLALLTFTATRAVRLRGPRSARMAVAARPLLLRGVLGARAFEADRVASYSPRTSLPITACRALRQRRSTSPTLNHVVPFPVELIADQVDRGQLGV